MPVSWPLLLSSTEKPKGIIQEHRSYALGLTDYIRISPGVARCWPKCSSIYRSCVVNGRRYDTILDLSPIFRDF